MFNVQSQYNKQLKQSTRNSTGDEIAKPKRDLMICGDIYLYSQQVQQCNKNIKEKEKEN